MPGPLSPQERSLRARLAAHELHSQYDSREITRAARAAGPGSLSYWERKVDPDGELTPEERTRRAGHKKTAYFQRLALRSVRARRQRAAGSADA